MAFVEPISQTSAMEQKTHDGTDNIMPYSESYMGCVTPELNGHQLAHGYLPMQEIYYYNGSYMTPRNDYMNSTCYQMNVDDAMKPGVPMYMGSHMGPVSGYNPMLYGPLDVTYCQPETSSFYGATDVDGSQMYVQGKGEVEDDTQTYAECSTTATTPNLDYCPNPEALDDGFDLRYGHEYEGYPMAPVDCYSNKVAPTGGYAGYNMTNLEDVFSPCRDPDSLMNDAMVVEIADEIASNVQYLPDKESSGKYSLDKNHPIHCVWRDVNRGHCSWRCRWWENGKRLSKNFNVKRFGEREAMWMAIAMKIRNSTPVERFQLLKEQREAVRNYCELVRQNAHGASTDAHVDITSMAVPSVTAAPRKSRSPLNSTKAAQKANWARIAWTYVMVPERRTGSTSVVCRLCAKTTKCSRSRNLQQAHIMHLLRMHKNPWKQYLDEEGLTKMCRSALDTLYQQRGYTANSEWKLRPGLTPPEPGLNYTSAGEMDSDAE
ncbi:uncharacterized protein BXIN_2746 [Babesia sp. Xinjiang]|uniref:uncharacterized protein n=1 Tax=Babesia sp. Xinjiang TaxID=462227 RepID=UPI000A2464AE|nr:uncharacterized protein BXIN_2746 [Babesia sp. Xinjiang]ORM41710.1 hypothetical protein BXIN_2746 [Babesia sp. Xinjiang]